MILSMKEYSDEVNRNKVFASFTENFLRNNTPFQGAGRLTCLYRWALVCVSVCACVCISVFVWMCMHLHICDVGEVIVIYKATQKRRNFQVCWDSVKRSLLWYALLRCFRLSSVQECFSWGFLSLFSSVLWSFCHNTVNKKQQLCVLY